MTTAESNGHSRECNAASRGFAGAREDGDEEGMARTRRLGEIARRDCPECRPTPAGPQPRVTTFNYTVSEERIRERAALRFHGCAVRWALLGFGDGKSIKRQLVVVDGAGAVLAIVRTTRSGAVHFDSEGEMYAAWRALFKVEQEAVPAAGAAP